MRPPSFITSLSCLFLALGSATSGLRAQTVLDPVATETLPIEPTAAARPFWGVAMGLRFANIPFDASDSTATDVFPLFYYEGEHVFLRGFEGGFKLIDNDNFGLNLVGRYRFFDIPREQQNAARGDALDMGPQFVLPLTENTRAEVELLTDVDGNTHANLRLHGEFNGRRWHLSPQVEIRAKSAEFNSAYYGLGIADVSAGVDARARLRARYQLYRNLHLVGSTEFGVLDPQARRSPFVEDTWEWEWYVGFGVFSDAPVIEQAAPLEARPYWRLAQGWGSDATIAEIMMGQNATQPVDVRMTSLFYGHPLSDTVFGRPIEVFLTPGIVHHWSSSDQNAATEYVLAIKFYHTLHLPWRVRLGFAEGVSYVDSGTYYENQDIQRRNYRRSRLLNFLDFSADLNLGDVTRAGWLADWWLGASIHHRSGIFETSSMFGRVKGGSNFNTLYIQWSP